MTPSEAYKKYDISFSVTAQMLLAEFESGYFTSQNEEVYSMLKSMREDLDKRNAAINEMLGKPMR